MPDKQKKTNADNHNFKVIKITNGPRFHFKAYYDIQPWDSTGRYFLCMESDFQDRPPGPDDLLTLGMIALEKREFIPLARTHAWNFQQGCMPHWMPSAPDEIIFNDRIDGAFRSVVLNIHTGQRRILPMPIQSVSPDGRFGASLNYARWGEWRPGYGYAGITDPFQGQAQPAEDSVYIMDLQTGNCRPLVTMKDIAGLTSDHDGRRKAPMHFCHLMFNTDGSRLVGLMRWWCPELAHNVYRDKLNIDGAVPERRHCMWSIRTDGSELNIVVNDGLVSHADWRDPDHIIAWANAHYDLPPAYQVFDVRNGAYEIIGKNSLTEDGHMSYHPNGKWFLTDTYPDHDYMRTLMLYNTEQHREIVLGKFHAPPELKGELRCDLHPSWNRDGTQAAIDSIHEGGQRQVYIINVGEVNRL